MSRTYQKGLALSGAEGFAPILILLLVVAMGALVGGAYFYGKGGLKLPTKQPASSSSQASTTPTPDETADSNLYKSEYGFSLKYPSTWALTSSERAARSRPVNPDYPVIEDSNKNEQFVTIKNKANDNWSITITSQKTFQDCGGLSSIDIKLKQLTIFGKPAFRTEIETSGNIVGPGELGSTDGVIFFSVDSQRSWHISDIDKGRGFCFEDYGSHLRSDIDYSTPALKNAPESAKETDLQTLGEMDSILESMKITK